MTFDVFIQSLSDALLDELPYQTVCRLRKGSPKDRIGKDILLHGDEMDRFLEGFAETFGIEYLPPDRQAVSLGDMHNAVAKL